MANQRADDAEMEDDYDEDADSNFASGSDDDNVSNSSDDGEVDGEKSAPKIAPAGRGRGGKKASNDAKEDAGLDSGDEAALAEYRKDQKKRRKKGEAVDEDSDKSDYGWRARTRAMREKEQVEKKQRRPLRSENVTIDVEKLWEEMNRPGPPAPPSEPQGQDRIPSRPTDTDPTALRHSADQDIENIPPNGEEEIITIRRTFKFAGQVTTEEKQVPKTSAEARLWLSQQSNHPEIVTPDGRIVQRPLRKVSRFDPNSNDLESFKNIWSLRKAEDGKATKINVVDKSRQDWAADVDQQGDREDLEKHAKSKSGYLGQQDTLNRLAQARDDIRLGRKPV